MMHHYAIYETHTGKVVAAGHSSNEAVIDLAREGLTDGQSLYVGEIDPTATFLPGGVPAPKLAEPVVITAKDVKGHANRILSYTDWVDIRALNGTPVTQAMTAYRQAVRDRSGEIEAMSPIPADFRNPSYWPVEP